MPVSRLQCAVSVWVIRLLDFSFLIFVLSKGHFFIKKKKNYKKELSRYLIFLFFQNIVIEINLFDGE